MSVYYFIVNINNFFLYFCHNDILSNYNSCDQMSQDFMSDNHLDFPFRPGSLYKSASVTGGNRNIKNIKEKIFLT